MTPDRFAPPVQQLDHLLKEVDTPLTVLHGHARLLLRGIEETRPMSRADLQRHLTIIETQLAILKQHIDQAQPIR